MNRIQKLFDRQYGLSNETTYDYALRRLCVAKEDSWRGIVPSNHSSDYNPEPPIFSAKFANCAGYRHLLAIANEDGKIALQDTTKRNHDAKEQSLQAPQCHFNAVFDLEWAPGQMKFVSASGDHTARLWEVDGSDLRSVRVFNGHTRSVKTAAFRKSDASVFATGGRDGAIIIWDTRANLNLDLTPRVDNCIYSGHVGGPGTPLSQQKKRTRTPKLAPNASTTSSSITGLVFQDSNTLISCGAGDGIIKVWDLRRNYTAYKREPTPKYSLPYAGSSTFKGFTNLLIDQSGARLYANCMDNTIYCYNLYSYAPKPLARYKGLLNSTFYIKSCLSPDGKYLLSGSSDEKAYIWSVDYAPEPLVSLAGHTVEVTCVAWGSTHDQPIVTCSDDARHKIWRIGPEQLTATQRQEDYRGHAEFVRVFGQQQQQAAATAVLPSSSSSSSSGVSSGKSQLRDLESTPRSLKRLVAQNERTPDSVDKISTKRSFLQMLGAATGGTESGNGTEDHDMKRPKIMESRGRRLFGPCTSATAASNCSSGSSNQSNQRCLNVQLNTIPEERHTLTSPLSRNQLAIERNQEQTTFITIESPTSNVTIKLINGSVTTTHSFATTPSPQSERCVATQQNQQHHLQQLFTSPPTAVASNNTATSTTTSSSAAIYSPTTNLPNYVLDGDAPHLGIMSPKRKLKDKVDWLTKMRKQKLLSNCRGATLTDKINEHMEDSATLAATATAAAVISSPRLQSLRGSESTTATINSPRAHATPRRRNSQHNNNNNDNMSPSASQQHRQQQQQHHPKTPTSSRRNSETSILRFFSVQQQNSVETAATNSNIAAASTNMSQQTQQQAQQPQQQQQHVTATND